MRISDWSSDVCSSDLSLTLRSSAQQLDTLLVGALADPASAGFYHIAKQVGRMAQQIGVHVQAVLYPDVARLWAAGAIQEFRRAILQVEVMLAAFGIRSEEHPSELQSLMRTSYAVYRTKN